MYQPPKTRTRITGVLTYWPLLLVIDYLTTLPLFVRTNMMTKMIGVMMLVSITGIGAMYFHAKMIKTTAGWTHLSHPSKYCRFWAAIILLTTMANLVPLLVYGYWWNSLILTFFVASVIAGLIVEIQHNSRPLSQRRFEW